MKLSVNGHVIYQCAEITRLVAFAGQYMILKNFEQKISSWIMTSDPLQGTVIIPMLHSVHRDEDQWVDPWTFNPENFLDPNGNFKKNPAFLPFSAGTVCSETAMIPVTFVLEKCDPWCTQMRQWQYSRGQQPLACMPQLAHRGILTGMIAMVRSPCFISQKVQPSHLLLNSHWLL